MSLIETTPKVYCLGVSKSTLLVYFVRMLTAEQMRAARALLGWRQRHLSDASGVSLDRIKRLELGTGPISAYQRTIDALRSALENAGVEFIDSNGGGPGVRLKV